MGEPVKVVASMESIRLPETQPEPDPDWKQRRTITGSPVSVFDQYPWAIRTDMSAWMTFSLEDRIRKAKAYSRSKGDPTERCEILLYIIRAESEHPLGQKGPKGPASVAFHGLFPEEKNASA